MRFLLQITIPNDPFNDLVRKGTPGKTMQKLMEATKPEAAYFVEVDGKRTGFLVVDMKETSQIPALAEPWFLALNAEVRFRPTMTPDDLAKSNLDRIGKGW
jgi:hypothetical protein